MLTHGRQLDWEFDPTEVLQRWPAQRRVVMLHSGRYDARWSHRSILAEPVGYYRFEQGTDGGASCWAGPSQAWSSKQWSNRPLVDLRTLLNQGSGLWIGYLSYDLGRWIEKVPCVADEDHRWPIIELAYCPGYLVYDMASHSWQAHGTYALQGVPEIESNDPVCGSFNSADPVSVFSRGEYESAVAQVLDFIEAGDVFQVNLAQRFRAPFEGNYPWAPRALYQRLSTVSPAWYGGYLELGGQRVIASVSPEMFLSLDEDGMVTTRPIKGTRPASVSVQALEQSEKDTAELNMIVDLMRNDLGRVCDYGSIKITDARTIESHPTIHHGVATITGKLHHRKDVVNLLRAAMPGGSVTGAPKVRAMEIIEEIEPVRRGPYCGCLGFLSPQMSCLNIAIRTMMIDTAESHVDFSVGGGIVADSTPAGEYEETLDKAQALLAALGMGRSVVESGTVLAV